MKDSFSFGLVKMQGTDPLVCCGRSLLTGDWYVAVDVGPASKAAIELILSWAKEEGEPIVFHPQGPLMVRLEWMLSGKDPLMMNFREQWKRALEGVVLQSDS